MLYLCTNLDFEYELTGGGTPREQQHHEKMNRRWQSILKLYPSFARGITISPFSSTNTEALSPVAEVAEVQEGTRLPERDVVDVAAELAQTEHVLVCWGVSANMAQLAERYDARLWGADPKIVNMVNDKCVSHGWEQELGVALPHSAVVNTEEELVSIIRACPHDWVLKHPMGVSGRGRILGREGDCTETTKQWARTQWQAGWSLLFEPWVQDKEDFSLHLDIAMSGEIHRVGVTQLATTGGGAYRGNRVIPGWCPPTGSWDVAEAVAQKMRALGYWGPVGIDGLTGRLGQHAWVRPLVEVNARFSFGRMALALSHWVPQGWCYLWWHPTEKERKQGLLRTETLPVLSPRCEQPGVYALPRIADPNAQSQTFVVVADQCDTLSTLEKQVVLL